ncbi:aliphatic sulfonate ABC transporter substrate-binding protein [Loigolactobacillus coryniformis]|uniref:aliphatic sulfonate ABC transporter substrate-binding protein n=1 Tax=Loigolactobacillus coryniformis TaxID=1610 RepID=UPI00201A3FA2|nr:aliphatic sulfonate ABC transporter substrate-binding protein [Loigolactobacillus coryniformis]MCL5457825.1 aliphatic sulfonate ABC transporter substrate-binding protein [Loigolactobacillus coryniformis]
MKKHKWQVSLLFIALLAWLGIAFYGYRQTDTSSSALTTVTIGYQKADPVDIARQRGQLVKKMQAKGYKVVFKEFSDGTALLTALQAGDIDYARVGDTPPVTAQANGIKLVYVAAGAAKPNGSEILVGQDLGIKRLADLKGKQIAYAKGTSAQFFIIQALKKAGLTTSDVTLVNMDQAAASVAFAKGKVDAWVTWDPYTATAEVEQQAKVLVNGTGLVKDRDFMLSTRSYAKTHTTVTNYLTTYINDDMQWATKHQNKLIAMLSETLHLSKTIIKKQVQRRTYTMGKVTTTMIKEQQKIADVFYNAGLIDKKIKVKDALVDQ